MITPELISRYHFFADLDLDQLNNLAKIGEGITTETGEYIFHEGDELHSFYIVVEGAIGIVHEKEKEPDTVVSAVGPGHIFAWSSLVPPHIATASAKALTPCWLITFDCKKLLHIFQKDCKFGYQMMQKIVQISRDRLLDARIESLVFMA
ncbi:MAG: cyclic nucleotide-binding domain-containing protein [Anaerolineales bacterium]|nr:cyclic nucleotide-binding domain-containing protein [Anaerolineales bacterium]